MLKMNKYPVRFNYRIGQIVSDVITLGLVVMIVSLTINFIGNYRDFLQRINSLDSSTAQAIEDNAISGFTTRYWFSLVFPVLAAAVVVAYVVLLLKNHSFPKLNIAKINANACYAEYAFCVSLCKIPLMMIIFDFMYLFQRRMFGAKESFLRTAIDTLLYLVLMAIIIRFYAHRMQRITKPETPAAESEPAAVRTRLTQDKDDE